ncbi:MAG: hypothetical protein JWO58_756 [Chitinophagaceae bacterium]|nr:hypothetical protein [Chitinophagaceae bacterium]
MGILLQHKINTLCSHQKDLQQVFKPLFYRIYNPNERQDFSLLLDTPGLRITDCVLDQVKELMKINHPDLKLGSEEQREAALQHIKPYTEQEYGVWVYYPWSNRLVHIVDEKEFIDLRTSRNQYKITVEERELLAQKKIGVIGLSVGQSVAVTLAMERIATELRLADFDVLELTNLNRIRTGIHNLGLLKVYAVAREIAEIDPFLTVKCFSEGLSENNMDIFFMEGGKLDLLVEESDGFDIKILSRYKAKELRIPVIMEASDRCTVDVERFDKEPDRSILHGMVDHLDINILKTLKTTEDKIPYLLDMVGLETSSTKLKASMLEIDQTITTWPQLSSSVTMGGGIMADIGRRILLNTYTESGRYHVDIEELIGNKEKNNKAPNTTTTIEKSLSAKEMEDVAVLWISTHETANAKKISRKELLPLIEAAVQAPSGGNMQPWKWFYSQGNLFLFHDIEKSAALLDYNNQASYISLGAAAENMVLKAHQEKMEIKISLFPELKHPRLIAVFQFFDQHILPANIIVESHENDSLIQQVQHRFTNRTISERKVIDPSKLQALQRVARSIEGANMIVMDSPAQLEELGDIIAKVERIRIMNERGHNDFVHEIRWTASEAQKEKDGIDLRTVDLTASEKAGFLVSKDWKVIQHLKQWHGGTAFEKLSKKTIAAASAIGFITMPKHEHSSFFNGGRAVQRVWLAANEINISFQPQSPATFLFARASYDHGSDLNASEKKELMELKKRFQTLMGIDSGIGEIFLFRLCVADEPKIKSLRRDIQDVLFFHE